MNTLICLFLRVRYTVDFLINNSENFKNKYVWKIWFYCEKYRRKKDFRRFNRVAFHKESLDKFKNIHRIVMDRRMWFIFAISCYEHRSVAKLFFTRRWKHFLNFAMICNEALFLCKNRIFSQLQNDEPTKHHLFCFTFLLNPRNSVAENHRVLIEIYNIIINQKKNRRTCWFWYLYLILEFK